MPRLAKKAVADGALGLRICNFWFSESDRENDGSGYNIFPQTWFCCMRFRASSRDVIMKFLQWIVWLEGIYMYLTFRGNYFSIQEPIQFFYIFLSHQASINNGDCTTSFHSRFGNFVSLGCGFGFNISMNFHFRARSLPLLFLCVCEFINPAFLALQMNKKGKPIR